MTVSPQDIANLFASRRLARGPELARMQEVQSLYDGAIVVALPELNKHEKSAIPNRAREGLKQFSQRIASAIPSVRCYPLRFGIEKSERRAHDRRMAILGWWEFNKMGVILRQRARFFQGYGATPVQIRWDPELEIPRWEVRNPLATYPAHMRGPEDMRPPDCIFETTQTLGWLGDRYPGPTSILYKGNPNSLSRDLRFTLLEYLDEDECVLVVLGAKPDPYLAPPPGSMAVELERYPNRAGRCTVLIPRQITLSQPHGQFDGMAGMHQTEAILTALAIQATRKGVFTEEWLIAHPNEEPVIVEVPNPGEGIPGVVKGGTLQPRAVDPQFQTNITADRLADAQMRQSGLSSELQGISPSNTRTGARASLLLSNVIDFPIQEAQELLQESIQDENKDAIAIAKAYGGTKSFYVNWQGAQGPVTYDPTETFETDQNRVRYPMAGVDQAGLVISAGQRVGMGTMSKETFMEIDPLIEDPEKEQDRIVAEKLEEALLGGFAQQLAAGAIPPIDGARVAELIGSDQMQPFEAIIKAHEEAQARQATPAPTGAPETQPGLGGPAAQPAAIGPTPDTAGLANLLSSLRRPQSQVLPQELTQTAGGPTTAASVG